MEAVNIIMKLFTLMGEDEKRETVKRIGNDLDKSGLADEWAVKSASAKAAPKKKRRGAYRAFWMKSIDAIDLSKRGMDQISGGWVKADDVAKMPKKSKVLLGIKGGEYLVCVTGGGFAEFKDARGEVHRVEGMEIFSNHETFNDAVELANSLI
jgi:hypothetical protein